MLACSAQEECRLGKEPEAEVKRISMSTLGMWSVSPSNFSAVLWIAEMHMRVDFGWLIFVSRFTIPVTINTD